MRTKKNYAAIVDQIEALKAEAEGLRSEEVKGVVARIKEAIAAYELTAQDLGFSGVKSANAATSKTTVRRRKSASKGGTKSSRKIRFRDDQGNIWGGRGPRPHWLRTALKEGKQLSDFDVDRR